MRVRIRVKDQCHNHEPSTLIDYTTSMPPTFTISLDMLPEPTQQLLSQSNNGLHKLVLYLTRLDDD